TLMATYNVREAQRNELGILFNLDEENANRIKNNPGVRSIHRAIEPKGKWDKTVFPHDVQYLWNKDNFGPLYMPKKGATVKLNEQTIPFYRDLLKRYEHINFTEANGKYYVDGKSVTDYTFKQDYFFMMGDNRHYSLDARFWGFTPFDHVVGKPVFIWMSWNKDAKGFFNKIRTERLFTTVGLSGKPVSYFYYFLGALALYIGYGFFKKKKA
ncbi:MAG: S26 family signal peptidase, partial [Flavobacteriaceae bacterium]